MYPEERTTPNNSKQVRGSHSFTKPKGEEAKQERRQRSLIQHNKIVNFSPAKSIKDHQLTKATKAVL